MMSLSEVFDPKNPAFSGLMKTPEVLIGIGGVILILYFAFSNIFPGLAEAGNKTDSEVSTIKQEVETKKNMQATVARLKSEADMNTTELLLLNEGELASVKVYDFVKELQRLNDNNTLGLPSPHNQIMITNVMESSAEFTVTSTPAVDAQPMTSGVTKVNLFDKGFAPFSTSELTDLKLNVQAEQYVYTIEGKGSYVGILDFVRKVGMHKPFVGIKNIEIGLDEGAPNILKFRPGSVAGVSPPPASLVAPKTGQASKEGVAPDAAGTELDALPKSAVSSSGQPLGAPLHMKLTVAIFLRDAVPAAASPPVAPSAGVATAAPAGLE